MHAAVHCSSALGLFNALLICGQPEHHFCRRECQAGNNSHMKMFEATSTVDTHLGTMQSVSKIILDIVKPDPPLLLLFEADKFDNEFQGKETPLISFRLVGEN